MKKTKQFTPLEKQLIRTILQNAEDGKDIGRIYWSSVVDDEKVYKLKYTLKWSMCGTIDCSIYKSYLKLVVREYKLNQLHI